MIKIKKTKILHVVGAMNRAGTETMLMNLYRRMSTEKCQFDFVSYDHLPAHYDSEIEQLNGRIIRLSKTNSIRQLYQTLKKYGPYDVVHAHTLFHCGIVCLAACLAGVKIRIAHAHTTLDKSDSIVRRLYMTSMRFLITTFATNFLACSHEAGCYLFGKNNLTKQNYVYFPNVIEYRSFLGIAEKNIDAFKQEAGLVGCTAVIGHIGTFKQSKNHHFLIKVMKHLVEIKPDIQLVLAGDGELKQEIKRKAVNEQLVNRIKFIGVREDIPTILHSLDVFVFPSTFEGLGLVLLEAQASGLPCVVSEAIQPEADLGLGLIEKVTLEDGAAIWAEKIMQSVSKREKNISKISNAFEQSGFSVTNGIALLKELYNSGGGAYEKNLNRLL